jgi:hypothetical protein
MPVIPALEKMRQEDHDFQARPGYIARPCLKQTDLKKKIPGSMAG